MNPICKKILVKAGAYVFGLLALISLLFSVAGSFVTNSRVMAQGFLTYSDTKAFGVPPTAYGDYAAGICQYLNGKGESVQVPDPDHKGEKKAAFSEKENLHMQDVRGIITVLRASRIFCGGLMTAALILYLIKKDQRSQIISELLQGLALSALTLLLLAIAIGIWAKVNFNGLFWFFHQMVFTNDLWLLNPQTDLLAALMPLPFFTWYGGELFKHLLPVLGCMLLLVIAWFRFRRELTPGEHKNPQPDSQKQ